MNGSGSKIWELLKSKLIAASRFLSSPSSPTLPKQKPQKSFKENKLVGGRGAFYAANPEALQEETFNSPFKRNERINRKRKMEKRRKKVRLWNPLEIIKAFLHLLSMEIFFRLYDLQDLHENLQNILLLFRN